MIYQLFVEGEQLYIFRRLDKRRKADAPQPILIGYKAEEIHIEADSAEEAVDMAENDLGRRLIAGTTAIEIPDATAAEDLADRFAGAKTRKGLKKAQLKRE